MHESRWKGFKLDGGFRRGTRLDYLVIVLLVVDGGEVSQGRF